MIFSTDKKPLRIFIDFLSINFSDDRLSLTYGFSGKMWASYHNGVRYESYELNDMPFSIFKEELLSRFDDNNEPYEISSCDPLYEPLLMVYRSKSL